MKYLIIVLICMAQVFADDPKSLKNARDTVNKKIANLDHQYNKRLVTYLKDHLKELKSHQLKYTKRGDLETALLYKAEIDNVKLFITEASEKITKKIDVAQRPTSTKGFRSIIPTDPKQLEEYLIHPDVWFDVVTRKKREGIPVTAVQFREALSTSRQAQRKRVTNAKSTFSIGVPVVHYWSGVSPDGQVIAHVGGIDALGEVDKSKGTISFRYNGKGNVFHVIKLVTDRNRIRQYRKEHLAKK